MSYSPKTWQDGDVIRAEDLNKIEQGIATGSGGGGTPWDAVIRLVHANNSGQDTPENLTPSIISGTFADLMTKISNGEYPCILVQYRNNGVQFSAPGGYIVYANSSFIIIAIGGFSTLVNDFKYIGHLAWNSANNIAWN